MAKVVTTYDTDNQQLSVSIDGRTMTIPGHWSASLIRSIMTAISAERVARGEGSGLQLQQRVTAYMSHARRQACDD